MKLLREYYYISSFTAAPQSVRACLRGARLTESHATWRSRKHRKTGIHPSPYSFLWRVQLKHAHACDRAIRTKAALSFVQRSVNLTNSRLLSILATTPMLTITQREAQAKSLVCVRARVCVPRVAFVCVFYLIHCFRRFFSSLSYFDRPRTVVFSYRYTNL